LNFSGVTGTTDLSGPHADVTWTMSATLSFMNSGFGVTAANCTTDSFDIDISGDWAGTTSSGFIIPALPTTGAFDCNGRGANLNTNFGLGVTGATLSLYKFDGYNPNVNADLTGS
jgi:hypothetical protein